MPVSSCLSCLYVVCVCLFVCMSVLMRLCVHVPTCVFVERLRFCDYIWVCVRTCMCVCAHARVCMSECVRRAMLSVGSMSLFVPVLIHNGH